MIDRKLSTNSLQEELATLKNHLRRAMHKYWDIKHWLKANDHKIENANTHKISAANDEIREAMKPVLGRLAWEEIK